MDYYQNQHIYYVLLIKVDFYIDISHSLIDISPLSFVLKVSFTHS